MKYIPLCKVYMSESAIHAASETLRSGYIGQGPKVEAFEKRLSKYLDCERLCTVNSGTSALHLALHLVKDGERDEVLTCPMTCVATNTPIVASGLKIKWVDVDSKNCNMDLLDLRRKLSPKTLAVMLVHWGGYPVDLAAVDAIRDQYFSTYRKILHVIEDCAHAFGSTYRGKKVGSHSDIGVFSFGPLKCPTAGDGGLLTLGDNYSLHQRAKKLRWYGLDRLMDGMNHMRNIDEVGWKYHMNDIAASIGLANLDEVESILALQRHNAKLLREGLANVPGLTLLENNPDRLSSYWLFTVLVENKECFTEKLKEHGIQSHCVHKRNDKHTCFKDSVAFLPNLDYLSARMTCLPCGWWVTEEDVESIIACIKAGW